MKSAHRRAAIYGECREPNWDGYGAEAVTEETICRLAEFIALLPPGTPEPELSPEPDGCIAVEWGEGRSILSVSVCESGRLCYAAMFGEWKAHGVETFSGHIPDTILDLITRWKAVNAAQA